MCLGQWRRNELTEKIIQVRNLSLTLNNNFFEIASGETFDIKSPRTRVPRYVLVVMNCVQ